MIHKSAFLMLGVKVPRQTTWKTMKLPITRSNRGWEIVATLSAGACILVFVSGCSLQRHQSSCRNVFGFPCLLGKASRSGRDILLFNREWEAATQEATAGQTEKAIQRLRHLLRSYPDNSEIRLFLADLLLMEGKPEESIGLLRTLLDEAPQDGRVHYMLALAYDHAGQMHQALIHYEKALESEPDNEVYLASYKQLVAAQENAP